MTQLSLSSGKKGTAGPERMGAAVLAWMIGAFSACGIEGPRGDVKSERSQEFSQKIATGRRVSYTKTDELGPGLLLADGGMAPVHYVDGQSGSVVWLTGDTTTTDLFARDADLGAAAEELIRLHGETWGVSSGDLVAHSGKTMTQVDGRTLQWHFERRFDGILVRDAYFDVGFSYQTPEFGEPVWAFREVLGRHAGPISVANIQSSCAGAIYFDSLLGPEVSGEVQSSAELIMPHVQKANTFTYSRAVAVTGTRSDYPGEIITATFACGTGQLLEAHSDRIFAESRQVIANVFERSYLGGKVGIPMANSGVTDGAQNFLTDSLGTYTDPDGGLQASLKLDGARGYVVDQNVPMTLPISAFDGAGIATLSPAANALVATNAFVSVQRVNTFVRRHLTQAQAGILGARVRISINVAGSCNAYYTGTTVNFYPEGRGCANTALVNDVIYHEWGHGLDDYTGRQVGITDGAFSEGIGDIIAAYLAGDSNMAPGFTLNSTTPIRRLKNVFRFPDNQGEVHSEGMIIGGAFWDLREALMARYGAVKGAFAAEAFFFRHLLSTDSYRDSYQALVTLDDNDGNPATRSPNFCLINTAFAQHGLATAVADCMDAVVPDPVKVDADLALAINQSAPTVTVIMASSTSSRRMGYCLGTLAVCKSDTAKILPMKLDGTKGGRILFVSPGITGVTAGAMISVLTQDEAAVITGGRSVKAMSR